MTSRRLSAEIDGENTILSAVTMCDSVLADAYSSVLDGKMSQAQAWKRAKGNSKQFKRTV